MHFRFQVQPQLVGKVFGAILLLETEVIIALLIIIMVLVLLQAMVLLEQIHLLLLMKGRFILIMLKGILFISMLMMMVLLKFIMGLIGKGLLMAIGIVKILEHLMFLLLDGIQLELCLLRE